MAAWLVLLLNVTVNAHSPQEPGAERQLTVV